ncbi:MAG: glycosyltransferase [Chryseobacterium sp.]|uniref:glycosyltransferase n=1 Tax=Chryseobacterium sp. TaxID=1871047 RepID=UPI001B248B7C|nr:glycosyltransferase [Chryseobacterium sp.]MBO6185070.1 glycosyltransferase [Chryseobacterium sp.]
MKVLIDNSNLYAGGGIQVATSFLYDLVTIEDENQYHVIQSVNSAKQINISDFDKRFKFYDLTEESKSILNRIKRLREIEEEIKPNVIFTVFGPSYHKSKFPKVVGFALGQVLYPESPYFKKISSLSNLKVKLTSYFKSYFFKKNSDVLIYESGDANKVYSNITKNKIVGYTVTNTVNNVFLNCSDWKEIYVVKSKFDILYLTANYPHKNIEIIPKVIDEILKLGYLEDFKFHLSVTEEEMNFDKKYDQYINYLGKVDINQVPLLYKQMNLLFMPTLLETFSTTYLEAMISEIPIVTSKMSFAQDVCGDSALYCEPLSATDYAKKISLLTSDNELRNSLIQKGKINLLRFGTSMDRTKKYLEILEKHANANY